MEKTCKTCMENDCGLRDRTGRLVKDDDQRENEQTIRQNLLNS